MSPRVRIVPAILSNRADVFSSPSQVQSAMSPAANSTFVGANTVTVILAKLLNPPLSVAVAVMVCTPTEKLERLNVAPVPICPSMLDVHTKMEETSPS